MHPVFHVAKWMNNAAEASLTSVTCINNTGKLKANLCSKLAEPWLSQLNCVPLTFSIAAQMDDTAGQAMFSTLTHACELDDAPVLLL